MCGRDELDIDVDGTIGELDRHCEFEKMSVEIYPSSRISAD